MGYAPSIDSHTSDLVPPPPSAGPVVIGELQLSSGPLTIDGVDFSAVSFLLGEWVDSLGHCVSVVARDEQSAKARISWDHKNQKKTK